MGVLGRVAGIIGAPATRVGSHVGQFLLAANTTNFAGIPLAYPAVSPAAYASRIGARPWRGASGIKGCQSNPDFQWCYRVEYGDTLAMIALMITGDADKQNQLAQINGVNSPAAGKVLRIPIQWNQWIDELGYPAGADNSGDEYRDCYVGSQNESLQFEARTGQSSSYGFVRRIVPSSYVSSNEEYKNGYSLGAIDCKNSFNRSLAAGVDPNFASGYQAGRKSCLPEVRTEIPSGYGQYIPPRGRY